MWFTNINYLPTTYMKLIQFCNKAFQVSKIINTPLTRMRIAYSSKYGTTCLNDTLNNWT